MTQNAWQGKRVRLRAMQTDDWETHFEWDQDTEVMRRVAHVHFPPSKEGVRKWVEETVAQKSTEPTFFFEIETLGGVLVGAIVTHRADPRVGNFYYGIGISDEHQRQGYASEAIGLVLRHYFGELRYQKCTVEVYSFNEPSLRLHERLGFQREGQIRRTVYTQGQYFDRVLYGMTAEEFWTNPCFEHLGRSPG